MKTKILDLLDERRNLYASIKNNDSFIEQIACAAELIQETINSGDKILIFGNGGSAAEAQHFAAELVCQFEKKRRAIAAIALTTDNSILTAQANDFGFETVFSRQIEALARPGDLVIGFTTSDPNYHRTQSRNILSAFAAAKNIEGLKKIGFFGARTQYLLGQVDVAVVVPCFGTAMVQEVHQVVIHMLCSLIEEKL